jgi:hypothetical protein
MLHLSFALKRGEVILRREAPSHDVIFCAETILEAIRKARERAVRNNSR